MVVPPRVPLVSRKPLAQKPSPGSGALFPRYFFFPQNRVFHGCGGCRAANQVCRTTFHVCCMAIHAFGTQIEAYGTEFEVFARRCLLWYHFFHSLLCTIDVPMYTAGEVVFCRRSDGTLVLAAVLGPGAHSETVQIVYKRNERLMKHPAASLANLFSPIPVIPDSPEWGSSSTPSLSPPPRTRPVERCGERSTGLSGSLSRSLSQLPNPRQQPTLAPRGSTDRNSGWCITGRRVSCWHQLNIRSFHAHWKVHCSPVS